MFDSWMTARRIRLLGLALLAVGLPACHGAGPVARDETGRIAYRPVNTSMRGRLFYVSGYGGADYSPARPRRTAPVAEVPAYATPAPIDQPPSVTVNQGTWDEP